MLITDQVAIAPCVDSIQVRISTFEAKQLDEALHQKGRLHKK